MSSDKVIVNEIRSMLASDSRLPHPSEIAIGERSGVVTLRGTVNTPAQLQAAIKITKSHPGVSVVEDELRLDPRDHWEDNELRGAVLQALLSNDSVPADRIEVTVADRWVTMKGEVRHQSESNAAYEAISQVPGIGGITSTITVISAGVR